MDFYKEIIELIKDAKPNKEELAKLKTNLSRKFKLKKIPKDAEILSHIQDDEEVKGFLSIKPIRTVSGVAPISLFTLPEKCKHGTCIFCPGGPDSIFGDVPQSYTGNEPASRRAIRNLYDPYLQIFNRLEHYTVTGHNVDKVELIIQGGTFPSYDKKYQEEFAGYCFKALNDFSDMFFKNKKFDKKRFNEVFELPGDIYSSGRIKKIHEKLLKLKLGSDLIKEQSRNEKSKIRNVAFVVETKPDWCFSEHINQMLNLGTTRVELGVQTVYNDILKINNRGHTLEDTIKAIQLLKDSFLKATYHIMPGLYGSDREKDVNIFKEIFTNQDFMPDALKVYPCLVMKGTPLYELWKKGKFQPLTTKEAIEIIIEGKKYVEKFCRIIRCQRDIPTNITEDGPDRTNLRQYIQSLMEKRGIKCKCIRCREPKTKEIDWDNVELLRHDYNASNSEEVFLSFEDVKNDMILGFLRLRKPYKSFRREITDNSIGIRELHVYGTATALGEEGKIQHRGLGKKLMLEAEKIAKEEFDAKKILVLSGIGVREYFKNKFNYMRDGVYMSKILK